MIIRKKLLLKLEYLVLYDNELNIFEVQTKEGL